MLKGLKVLRILAENEKLKVGGGEGRGGRQKEEIGQTMCAHMNKLIKKKLDILEIKNEAIKTKNSTEIQIQLMEK
jgi:hypothetical protein